MADETPKRFKGQKHLEAGYRAGFAAGHRQGLIDANEAAQEDEERERLMQGELARLRGEQQTKPKRTRRTKPVPDESTGDASQPS